MALDLETTGLSPDNDDIIEVGAVKFHGETEIGTYQSFVNPYRTLDSFIRRYTGISQADVDNAPPFSQVAPELASFVGTLPIVGHNIPFDLGFLKNNGLNLSNQRTDTWDLAYVLLPENRNYSLSKLAQTLLIDHLRPHRAIDDASVTRMVFLKLVAIANELDISVLTELKHLSSRSSWILDYLIRQLEQHTLSALSSGTTNRDPDDRVVSIDLPGIRRRLQTNRPARSNHVTVKASKDLVSSLLSRNGPLSQAINGFEKRSEQVAMANAVSKAITDGTSLVVEAGTGVGKSLAYLVPAAVHALNNNLKIVISTNTITLQEQLLNKDIPDLVKALREMDGIPEPDLKATLLKGRSNYLCIQRWGHLRSGDNISIDDARMLAKTLVWMGTTDAGDRGELNLGPRAAAASWDRISAQGAPDCTGISGVCFLKTARERAASAHILVVNHALLMSDLNAGGALIPDYDVLIIDEAHHLEQVATQQLGFELSQDNIDSHLQSVVGDSGILAAVAKAFHLSSVDQTRSDTINEVSSTIRTQIPELQSSTTKIFNTLSQLLGNRGEDNSRNTKDVRITSATRAQPAWSNLEINWEQANTQLVKLHRSLIDLDSALDGLEESKISNYDSLVSETRNLVQTTDDITTRLSEFIPQPDQEYIYWANVVRRTGSISLNSAPLSISTLLEKHLFSQNQSVILTGATLSTNGTFDHIRERTGFTDAKELMLGSPFNYTKSAILYVPSDIPEPNNWAYQGAIEQAISDASIAAEGRTMALFTSHSALQETARSIRGSLRTHGIQVLAQNTDGPPHRLVEEFLKNPKSLLLGTSSFWEGVDLAGDALSVLIVARLPFAVPTDPVFSARSELFDDPFNDYAVPQAIIRIRQGFGRLIRTSTDRGAAIILDRRVVSRNYSKAFIESLPKVPLIQTKLHELPEQLASWLKSGQ